MAALGRVEVRRVVAAAELDAGAAEVAAEVDAALNVEDSTLLAPDDQEFGRLYAAVLNAIVVATPVPEPTADDDELLLQLPYCD